MNTTALQLKDFALPTTGVEAYLCKINQLPILTPEEEQDLAIQLYDHGDLSAARQLITSHLRFVVHVAKSYQGYGLPFGDLIQEGNIGLMKAVKRFNPHHGVRLITFAVHWIKSEICDFVVRNWRLVKVATTKAQRKLFFNLRKQKKTLQCLTPSEAASIAEDLGVKEKDVLEMEKRLFYKQDGHYNTVESCEEEDASIHMQVNHQRALTQTDDPAQQVIQGENPYEQPLEAAIEQLDLRSQTIVKNRWLTEKKETLQSLAEQFGISVERVRQVEKAALQQLKSYLV